MATNYQAKVMEAEAEIEKARIAHDELQGMLASLEEEYAQLEEASGVNVSALPVGSVREAVTLSTRLAIEGPALRQTMKELKRRVEKSNQQFSNLYQQRDMHRSQLAGDQAVKMLAASPALPKAITALEEAAALWQGIPQNFHQMPGMIDKTRRMLQELSDIAKRDAAAGQ